MNYKPIIIVAGEPNSIFLEIFLKKIQKYKAKNPLILIASMKLIRLQMNYFKIKKKVRVLNYKNIFYLKLNNNTINIIDVEYKTSGTFDKSSLKSNRYIEKCFKVAFKILKTKKYINLLMVQL